MPGDPLESPQPEVAGASAPEKRKRVVCEFCECTLTPTGDAITISSKAKTLRSLEEKNKELEGTIETLRGEIERLKTPPAPSDDSASSKGKRKFFF